MSSSSSSSSSLAALRALATDHHAALMSIGASGALLMFAADLVLYYPTNDAAPRDRPDLLRRHRSASSYFATIDPGGDDLASSSMRRVSVRRAMLGGALGPVASALYAVGYAGVFLGLSQEAPRQGEDEEGGGAAPVVALAAVAAGGLSLTMTIGAVYHALFAYTCFLSREIAAEAAGKKKKKDDDDDDGGGGGTRALLRVLALHRAYLRYVYRWAFASGLVGSAAFAHLCLCGGRGLLLRGGGEPSRCAYPPHAALFVPAVGAQIKKALKRYGVGGIVLCGGLTNLWNLCLFVALRVGFDPTPPP